MINGESTRDATSISISAELPSPDPFDSFSPLRLRQSDDAAAAAAADASPSSRYSSCGGDSEFDRYCSANSLMGTPSMCSTVTVFNDFPEFEFGSLKSFGIGEDNNNNNGLENFSLGAGRAEVNHSDQRLSASARDFRTGFCGKNLRYGSSGLEMYGDDGDEGLMGFNQLVDLDQSFPRNDGGGGSEVDKGHRESEGARDYVENLSDDEHDDVGNVERCVMDNVDGIGKCCQSVPTIGEGSLSCEAGGMDQLSGFDTQSNLRIGEREIEGEEDVNSSDCQHSEGEDSMYNYGPDDDDDDKKESYLSRSMHYRQESEVRNENPLLMNSSVAFGSEDLDDFLVENERCGQVSVMSDLFHSQQQKSYEVEGNAINFGSASSMGSRAGQNEEGNDKKDSVTVHEKVEEIKDIGEPEAVKEVRDVPAACCQVQGADNLTNITESSTHASTDFPNTVKPQVEGSDKLVNFPKTSSISKAYEVDLDPPVEEAPQRMDSNVTDRRTIEKGNQDINIEEAMVTSDAQRVKKPELDNSEFKFNHFSDYKVDQGSYNSTNHLENINAKSFENLEQIVPSSNCGMTETLECSSSSTNLLEESPVKPKREDFELNEFYDEVVQEMEEILLDSVDSPGSRLAMSNKLLESQLYMPLRDGGLTASTSSTDDAYPLVQCPTRIDRIEVVGARQKKGDVSFSERLVGVKEYTVYKIKVWSGKDQWEVERRYRDFFTLYRCMKTLFADQGWTLPLPWSSVENESKKIFRSASPDVIVERSVLIQECLQSILGAGFFSSPPRALIWFLSPQDSHPISTASNALVSQSPFTRGTANSNISTLGKTISLIVEVSPSKSMKQLLEAQHNTCAGCHKHFDDGKTLIRDLVQTFGWGKPRLCEYTGQLFCSSCHTNETAVLPARVLHNWDFTQYPVSQLAKSYLDSIHEQPMLCVTAVNPFLLSKVPALLLVMSVRKKIGTMLPYVRCPFRRSINRVLGSRRYLLERNDFFSLKDLIDLSKGAFAVLPVMVETVSRKILEHITDQCLICCDVGVPCSARQDCRDPSSLIFPFQEDEIERCKTCQSVFHKPCFRKIANCPCGVSLRLDETRSLTNRASQRESGETGGTLNLIGRGLSSGLSSRFLSGLFTKEKPERTRDHRDENIILMGSLPSTSL